MAAMAEPMLKVFVVRWNGADYWTVGLDPADSRNIYAQQADYALQTAVQSKRYTNKELQTADEGSFGGAHDRYLAPLIAALREIDEGRNVTRCHFDRVYLPECPESQVIAIASNRKRRIRAAKIALCCRLMFEEHLGSLDKYEGDCRIMQVAIRIIRFVPVPMTNRSAQPAHRENTSEPKRARDGVWTEQPEPMKLQPREPTEPQEPMESGRTRQKETKTDMELEQEAWVTANVWRRSKPLR